MNLPIGSIVAWHKSFANTPALDPGWVECNGQTLSDAESPYNGQTIPDLNGGGRFLRGAAASGAMQDDAMQGHRHPLAWGGGALLQDGANAFGGAQTIGNKNGIGDPNPDGVNGNPRVASETRPKNMAVVWIMKVKENERLSRLLPEDSTPHFHATVTDENRKIYGHEIPMKAGFEKGVSKFGKIPLMNLDMFSKFGNEKGAIVAADEMEVSIPFAYILKLNPDFNVETGELAFYDEGTSTWLTAAQAGLTVVRATDSFKITPTTWPTDDRLIGCY